MHILLLLLALAGIALAVYWTLNQRSAPPYPPPQSAFERDISSADFQEMVIATSHTTPVLVDFYARWCGPCHAFAPILSQAMQEYKGAVLLARVDFDRNPDLVRHFEVQCIPTLALFRNGQRVAGFEGGRLPHQLQYFLASNGITPATGSLPPASETPA